jgi:FG-GAP-like repeat
VLAGAPQPVAPGLPRRLQLGDINGDGSVDAIVGVEFTSPLTQLRSTTVAVYLSTGTGELGEDRPLSAFRLGQRNDRLVFDLGDWNSDDVLDLLVGWNTVQSQLTGNNLRVLFGGTR